MTYILGISCFYHDSAAALLKDGEIISAVQEERFSRLKHDASFPVNSIKYILNENNISLDDINFIVFYEKPFLKFERILETYLAFAPKGFKAFCLSLPVWLNEKLFQKKLILENLKEIQNNYDSINKIKFSDHHLSHAASAFYPSPFKESLILTIDGVGEWSTTTIGIGKENKLDILEEIKFPHSIGLLYSAFTYYLGFKVNSGEYKLMGLAPFGEGKYKNLILENLIDLKEDGSFKLNMDYFTYTTDLKMIGSKFNKLFGKKNRIAEKNNIEKFHMDVAKSIQEVCEEIVIKICNYIRKKYCIENLCLAGGVALNCVINGKIIKNKIFKNLWIQPAAGDAGGALGAAFAYWYKELKNTRTIKLNQDSMKGSFLGPSYNTNYIENLLKRENVNYEKIEIQSQYIKKIVSDLKLQNVIGWFQNKMEFGPRALGARSIIADPRVEDMQKRLNLKIKFRESFRPFAPVILNEFKSKYFDLNIESPYMLIVSDLLEEYRKYNLDEFDLLEKINNRRSFVPAITHVDYSARIQTITSNNNLLLYDLMKEFYNQTDCPMLVNTSFNIRGEPIVCTPEDALRCFFGTDMDILAIGEFYIRKDKQIKTKSIDYKKQFSLD